MGAVCSAGKNCSSVWLCENTGLCSTCQTRRQKGEDAVAGLGRVFADVNGFAATAGSVDLFQC